MTGNDKPRCPEPGCVFRWRSGTDRPCKQHDASRPNDGGAQSPLSQVEALLWRSREFVGRLEAKRRKYPFKHEPSQTGSRW